MDHSPLSQATVEFVETVIWHSPPGQLRPLESLLTALPAFLGLRVEQLLRELSDESLALAVRYDLFRELAFEELLVNRYVNATDPEQGCLYRWFWRWGTDSARAQDLVQQLVANFLIHELHTFVPTYSFRSYLYRSAYNLWVQDQRREKVRRACSLEHSPEPPSREASVVAELQGKELEAQLEAAWSLLTPQQQRVMRETLNETPNEAIAASLGLTVQAVCMVRWRARTKLRALLGMPAREDCSDGILV